jgi:hypothetical protein
MNTGITGDAQIPRGSTPEGPGEIVPTPTPARLTDAFAVLLPRIDAVSVTVSPGRAEVG